MTPELLLNKISATIFGVAIGDSLGIPGNGLSIYESNLKYGYIDGFFGSKNFKTGQYSYLTNNLIITLSSLFKTNLKLDKDNLIETYLKASEKGITLGHETIDAEDNNSLGFIFKNIPLSIISNVQSITDKELINNFKTVSILTNTNRQVLYSIIWGFRSRIYEGL